MKRKLLFAMLCIASALGLKAQQKPEAGKTYYLYNPTTGLFLSRGARYGTAAWADNFGIPVTLIANDNGYRLQYLDANTQFVSDPEWSWADGGTNRAQTYTLTELEGNQYKLVSTSHADNKTLYISETAEGGAFTHQVASDGAYGVNCNENWDVWQFLSSAEREAILADKKEEIEKAVAQAVEVSLSEGKDIESALAEKSLMPVDKTSAVTNAALASNTDGWTSSNTTGNFAGQKGNGVEMYQGSGVLSQTVKGLEAGVYKVSLSAFFRDGENANCSAYSNNGWRVSNAYLEANGNQTMIADWASARSSDSAPNDPPAAIPLFNEGKYLNEVFAVVGEDGNLTINIAQPGAAVGGRWFLFTNLKLTYYTSNFANADDYAAFNKALAAAKEHTLGFEAGEYAPYNNVEAEKALAEAEKIDVNVTNEKEVIVTLTEALNNSVWVANEEEVNAIFDGSFEYPYSHEGNVQPIGWQSERADHIGGYYIRYMWDNEANPGLNATTSGNALFTKFEALYGKEQGYTLPLKANTTYVLTFIYGRWAEKNSDSYVTITSPSGESITITPSNLPIDAQNAHQDKTSWKSYKAVFTTEEAGDYVLGLRKENETQQSQYVYGDIKLVKAAPVEANIKVQANTYATFVAPFDVKIPEGVTASTVTSNNGATLVLEDLTGTIPAHTPVVLFSETAVEETVEGIATEGTPKAGLLTGVYEKTTAPEGSYVLQNQENVVGFYLVVDSTIEVPANRAYLTVDGGGVKGFFFGSDDATAVKGIEAAGEEAGAIYNLAGQRVEKAVKGVYIINGKKVLVK